MPITRARITRITKAAIVFVSTTTTGLPPRHQPQANGSRNGEVTPHGAGRDDVGPMRQGRASINRRRPCVFFGPTTSRTAARSGRDYACEGSWGQSPMASNHSRRATRTAHVETCRNSSGNAGRELRSGAFDLTVTISLRLRLHHESALKRHAVGATFPMIGGGTQLAAHQRRVTERDRGFCRAVRLRFAVFRLPWLGFCLPLLCIELRRVRLPERWHCQ